LRIQCCIVLRFFRSNQIFIAILLLAYLLVIRSGALFGWVKPLELHSSGGMLYQSWFGWLSNAPIISAWLSLALVFLQAVLVNFLADEFRILGERNWFPGLLYGLAASAFPEYLFVSAPLVAATFIPIVIWKIFAAYQKPNVHSVILDSGLWISAGSLFYPQLIWLHLAAFIGLSVVRVFRFREMMVYLAGGLIPLFWAWLWYFWLDQGSVFRDSQWSALLQISTFSMNWTSGTWLNWSVLALFTILFLLGLTSVSNKKGIQLQKLVSVLFWFLIAGILTTILQRQWDWSTWIIPIPSLAILLALGYLATLKKWWAELVHLLLFLFVLFIQYESILMPFFQIK
jgi:hypothetical protein